MGRALTEWVIQMTKGQRTHLDLCHTLRQHEADLVDDMDLEESLQEMVKHNDLSAIFTWKSVDLLTRAEQAVRYNPLPYKTEEGHTHINMKDFYGVKDD
jgi:hypothetical protein